MNDLVEFARPRRLAALLEHPRVTERAGGAPDPDGRCVVYWMQRAQRAVDNPALDLAIELGNELDRPVACFLGLQPFYPRANWRHYQFLVEGLPELARALERRGVAFVLRRWPEHGLEPFCHEVRPCLVVGDENPLREPEHWRRVLAARLRLPLYTVDADVVVPAKLLLKEQFAARTIRPRLHRLLDEFLVPSAEPVARRRFRPARPPRSLDPAGELLADWPIDRGVSPVAGLRGSTSRGLAALARFLDERLDGYHAQRNRPDLDGTSRLSPYLHFGHLGPRQIALAVRASRAPRADRDAFLEELIVRRELAVNFVRYNRRYDSLASCEPWARRSLAEHARDPRGVRLTEAQLEAAESPDPLWNAAQRQMVLTGWMHGYLRMYWAKKILEWSPSAARAYAVAVRLNDRYELDGRDPNGYAGIAWAIGGKHDRAWGPDRPIYGKVRYMSLAGASRKFDCKEYLRQIAALERA